MMLVFDTHDLAVFEKIYLEVCEELSLDPDASSTPSQREVLAQIIVDAAHRWNSCHKRLLSHRPVN